MTYKTGILLGAVAIVGCAYWVSLMKGKRNMPSSTAINPDEPDSIIHADDHLKGDGGPCPDGQACNGVGDEDTTPDHANHTVELHITQNTNTTPDHANHTAELHIQTQNGSSFLEDMEDMYAVDDEQDADFDEDAASPEWVRRRRTRRRGAGTGEATSAPTPVQTRFDTKKEAQKAMEERTKTQRAKEFVTRKKAYVSKDHETLIMWTECWPYHKETQKFVPLLKIPEKCDGWENFEWYETARSTFKFNHNFPTNAPRAPYDILGKNAATGMSAAHLDVEVMGAGAYAMPGSRGLKPKEKRAVKGVDEETAQAARTLAAKGTPPAQIATLFKIEVDAVNAIISAADEPDTAEADPAEAAEAYKNCNLAWAPHRIADTAPPRKDMEKSLKGKYMAFIKAENENLEDSLRGIFANHLNYQAHLVEALKNQLDSCFQKKKEGETCPYTELLHPDKRDELHQKTQEDHGSKVEKLMSNLTQELKTYYNTQPARAGMLEDVAKAEEGEMTSEQMAIPRLRAYVSFKKEVQKAMMEQADEEIASYIKKKHIVPKLSNNGICFSSSRPGTELNGKAAGEWPSARYCICPVLDPSWNDADYQVDYAWLSHFEYESSDKFTPNSFLDGPLGPIGFERLYPPPKEPSASMELLPPTLAPGVLPTHYYNADELRFNARFTEVQKVQGGTNEPGPVELKADFSGPFDLKGPGHGVFEIVAPLKDHIVGLKSLRAKNPCFLHLYKATLSKKKILGNIVHGKSLGWNVHGDDYVEEASVIKDSRVGFIGYLQGGMEHALLHVAVHDVKDVKVVDPASGSEPVPDVKVVDPAQGSTSFVTGDFQEEGLPPPGTPCVGGCVEESGRWGDNYCWTSPQHGQMAWGAPCVQKAAGTSAPAGSSSSMAETQSRDAAAVAARVKALTSLQNSFSSIVDKALKHTNYADSITHGMSRHIEEVIKTGGAAGMNLTKAEEENLWSLERTNFLASVETHAQNQVCLEYMPDPRKALFKKLGHEVSTVNIFKGIEDESLPCALSRIFNQVLDHIGDEKGACSLAYGDSESRTPCGKMNLMETSSGSKCKKIMEKGNKQCEDKDEGCIVKGTCQTAKPYPACPLPKKTFNDYMTIWKKLKEKFDHSTSWYKGVLEKLSLEKLDKGQTKNMKNICKAALKKSGLWIDRPDENLQLEGIVDLTNWENGRPINVRRAYRHGNDNPLVELYLSGHEDGKIITLETDKDKQSIKFEGGVEEKEFRYAIPREADLMNSLYIRLRKRVDMCRVQKVGMFNFHFEAMGSIMEEKVKSKLFGQRAASGKVAAVFMSPAAMTVYRAADNVFEVNKRFFGKKISWKNFLTVGTGELIRSTVGQLDPIGITGSKMMEKIWKYTPGFGTDTNGKSRFGKGTDKGFVGHDMGDAKDTFGDPAAGASPKAWWEECQKKVTEGGWSKDNNYGQDVCLLCDPKWGDTKVDHPATDFENVTGDCTYATVPYSYVYKDEEGDAPIPRFLSWTRQARKDLADRKDYRGFWKSDRMVQAIIDKAYGGGIPGQYVGVDEAHKLGFSVPTRSVIGVHDYDKEMAKTDSNSKFTEGSTATLKEKPGYDYNLDKFNNCFVVALGNLPEETKAGWHLGDYTRMRLCTNHYGDSAVNEGMDKRFDSEFNLRPDVPPCHNVVANPECQDAPPLTYADVSTKKQDVMKDIKMYVMSVSSVTPKAEDGEDTGAPPKGEIPQPSCYATTEADRDANTCMAGIDLLPGVNSTCAENPANPCREGSKCKCDMGFNTLEGKLKFGLALLCVQAFGFSLQYGAGIPAQTALALQMNAGPMDTVSAFSLLTMVEGKKSCKCVDTGFPTAEWRTETLAKGGCLGTPMKIDENPGQINQLNPYWFLPAPGYKIKLGRGTLLKGAGIGAVGTMMALTMIPSAEGAPDPATGEATMESPISPELRMGLMIGGGVAGALASKMMSSCNIVRCRDEDYFTGWVEDEGFANCHSPGIALKTFKERKQFYDKHLINDDKLNAIKQMIKDSEDERIKKMENVPHKMWEIALRLSHPEHFGMSKGKLETNQNENGYNVGQATKSKEFAKRQQQLIRENGHNETDPWYKKTYKIAKMGVKRGVHYAEVGILEVGRVLKLVITGNPASQIAFKLVSAAFDILDEAQDFVKSALGKVVGAITSPFKYKSKKITQLYVMKHYHDECMALQCHNEVHGSRAQTQSKDSSNTVQSSRFKQLKHSAKLKAQELKEGTLKLLRRPLIWSRQIKQCPKEAGGPGMYKEEGLTDDGFQASRLAFMVDQFAEQEASEASSSSMLQINTAFEEFVNRHSLLKDGQEAEATSIHHDTGGNATSITVEEPVAYREDVGIQEFPFAETLTQKSESESESETLEEDADDRESSEI